MNKQQRRLLEMFSTINKVDLSEYLNEGEFDVDNDKDVRELHVSLSSTGIEKIEEEYPEWVVEELSVNKFIGYDDRLLGWYFTEEGRDKFSSPQELKNWLMSVRDEEDDPFPVEPESTPPADDGMGGPIGGLPMNEGVLNEDDKNSIITEFIDYTNNHLGLTDKKPNITISQDPKEAANMRSFGLYTPDTGEIRVVAVNRNLADVLRTLAHEMVHFLQHSEDRLYADAGKDGSDIENEANAKAAVIMREFGRNNPIIFE